MDRVKVITQINSYKKKKFEALKHQHNTNYADILEKGIDEIISEYDPESYLEIKLLELEKEMMETRQSLAEIRIEKEHENTAKKENKEVDEFLERMRNSKFDDNRKSLITQWNKNILNWSKMVDIFQFKNANEAKAWFTKKMVEEGVV